LRNAIFIFTLMNPVGSILGRRHRFRVRPWSPLRPIFCYGTPWMDRNMGTVFWKFDTCNNGPKPAFWGLRGTSWRVQASGIKAFPEIRFRFEGLFREKNPAGISAVLVWNVLIPKHIIQSAKGSRGFGDPIVDVRIRCERIVDNRSTKSWCFVPASRNSSHWKMSLCPSVISHFYLGYVTYVQ
jgi:hypothetical protein